MVRQLQLWMLLLMAYVILLQSPCRRDDSEHVSAQLQTCDSGWWQSGVCAMVDLSLLFVRSRQL